MKKSVKVVLSLLLSLALCIACAGCGSSSSGSASSDESSSDVLYTIGVAVYNIEDPEMNMFFEYYRTYIESSFPVSFIMSTSLNSLEDEIAFVEQMAEEGAEGIIAFYNNDLEAILETCAEYEMYYCLGSSSIEDSVYEAVKDNEWFLGVIGPDDEEEWNAGVDIAENFISGGAESYLILSGGAADGANYMHYTRVQGMLTALQDSLGLTYSEQISDLAAVSELTVVDTGSDEISITICPGYVQLDEGYANLTQALTDADYDALISAVSISDVTDELEAEIQSSETQMLIGVVDCFSEQNYMAFETTDANGNSLLNYVKGKYASMVAPAFVAMFNALEGDVDVVKPDGEAFRIYQTYWTAASEEEYAQLYGYTQSIYENAYSSTELMELIRAYNEDASYEAFEALTEASDVDSVLERLGESE